MESQEKQFSVFCEPQKASDVCDSLHVETVTRECLPTTEEELKQATAATPKTELHLHIIRVFVIGNTARRFSKNFTRIYQSIMFGINSIPIQVSKI